jgi:V/A-type H+/Na+-transporting ATPase subunit E
MSIEQILRKIDDDAAARAAEVVEEASAEARRIAGQYEAAAGKLKAELEDLAVRKAAEEERRLLVSEELELRKAALVAKHRILADLYDEAKQKIASLTGAGYLDLLASLIAARSATGREEIVPAAGQRGLLDKAFLRKVASSFDGTAAFTVAEREGEFAWGVVLREGKRVVDLSLGTVFDQVRERVEPEVSAILFMGKRGD